MEREHDRHPSPTPGRQRRGRSDDPPGAQTTSTDLQVEVSDAQNHLDLDLAALVDLTRRVLSAEGIASASISIALVDDPTIHALNRRHLGHDWPTDVITFRLSESGEPELAAELVLSAEMALTTAGEAGLDPLDELALYLVHGLLHLCGHDDLTPDDADAMRRREALHLAREGITNTFAMLGPTAEDSRRGGSR